MFDSEPRWWLSDYDSTVVDINGVQDFAGTVDGVTERNYRPHADGVIATYQSGVPFGRTAPSQAVQQVVLHYHELLVAMTQRMTDYVNAARVFSEAARTVAQRYATADARAAAGTDDIAQIIGEASTRVRGLDQQGGASAGEDPGVRP